MNFRSIGFVIGLVYMLLIPTLLWGQSLPVGTPSLEDYYRRLQLTGGIDSNLSFSIRPIKPVSGNSSIHSIYNPVQSGRLDTNNIRTTAMPGAETNKIYYEILPFLWQQQYNSSYPYGWNDGPMIPAAGYQTLASGGIYFRYGILSVQLRPELVFASQKNFTGFASKHTDQDLQNYYSYYNNIDAPERFGTGHYTKANWGQSSIRLNWRALSLGLSTENLWWGPGIKNALIMTNNAPGFKHLSLNTTQPIKTGIGTFEGQVIAGKLDGTELPPLQTTANAAGENLYTPKRNDWRYISGVTFNYQPRWLPGLFLGVNHIIQSYSSDINGVAGYLPLISIYHKANYERDQIFSVYSRWLFAKSHAEVYFEYGWNDYTTAFITSPDHARAYVAGLRKLWPLAGKQNQGILVSTEFTQLSQSTDQLDNPAGGWYTHYTIHQGWTNRGQVLGAGIGTGGNLQSIDITWVMGFKKLGFVLERYEHNVDFALTAFPAVNERSRKWVDLGFGLQGEWDFKHLLLQGMVQPVVSYNYQWIAENYNITPASSPSSNAFNLHASLGILYRF
jgi:hypothetical protein